MVSKRQTRWRSVSTIITQDIDMVSIDRLLARPSKAAPSLSGECCTPRTLVLTACKVDVLKRSTWTLGVDASCYCGVQ